MPQVDDVHEQYVFESKKHRTVASPTGEPYALGDRGVLEVTAKGSEVELEIREPDGTVIRVAIDAHDVEKPVVREVCVSRLEGGGVTSQVLRDAAVMRRAREAALLVHHIRTLRQATGGGISPTVDLSELVGETRSSLLRKQQAKKNRDARAADQQRVVDEYVKALKGSHRTRQAPAVEAARRLHMTRRTFARYLAEAAERGLILPPEGPGKKYRPVEEDQP